MKLGNVLGIYEQALRVRTQRNEMLASNIANADTPGYKARDIDFRAVLKQQAVAPVKLKATAPGHFQPNMNGVSPQHVLYRTVSQPSMDGNTVDMQQEQLQFAANTAQFEATMRFLSGRIKKIETAIKGGE